MARSVGAAPSLDDVVALIAERRPAHGVCIVGLTGSVSVGKTTFAQSLAKALRTLAQRPRVEVACSDGFLFPNNVLSARDLIHRKGFPETYDATALRAALTGIRRGPVDFPGYSHFHFDIDRRLTREVAPPDILVIEGLGLDRNDAEGVEKMMDVLIYLDGREADIESWFGERFVGLTEAAKNDSRSFYARFSDLGPGQVRAVASEVWRGINLPNLREHIAPVRSRADIVVRKGVGHEIEAIEVGLPPDAGRAEVLRQ